MIQRPVTKEELADFVMQSRDHRKRVVCAASDVPPYRFLAAGLSPEKATIEAMQDLGTTHAADALAILWELRRVRG